MVTECLFSVALLIAGIVTLTHQPCSATSSVGVSLNAWLIVAGATGIFYALIVFVLMALICLLACCVCCLLPIFIVLLLGKIVFFFAWAIVGVLLLALDSGVVNDCPVAFGFAIVAIVALCVDLVPTYIYTRTSTE